MNGFGALCRKELHALFTAPIAWVVIAVFLLLMGYNFTAWLFVGQNASLVRVLHQAAVLLLLFVPILTMRTFAEERRLGTLALLLSTPAGEVAIVLAKFLACAAVTAAMLVPTLAYPLVLQVFGQPDWGAVYAGYLGLALLAGALIAIGLCASAFAGSQVIAAVVALGMSILLWALDALGQLLPDPYDVVVVNGALLTHFVPLSTGVVYLSDIGYFLTLILAGLFLCARALERP
ncbi:MAG: ABC transporter permease [Gammaproteobacteria bacterium]